MEDTVAERLVQTLIDLDHADVTDTVMSNWRIFSVADSRIDDRVGRLAGTHPPRLVANRGKVRL
ncbi:MAG TPA: hypothetical protein VMU39_11040 [Solirubrobacteraceae bacterium]|nr:hypothetical protein [Solirubrobacteraceae bacterium]